MLQQSSTAMGATFDPELLHTIGLKLLAPEARLKAASLALAPTCNIQRVRRSSMIHLAALLTFINLEPSWWQGVTDLPSYPSELTPSRRASSPSLRTLAYQEPLLLRILTAFKKAESAPRSSTSGVLSRPIRRPRLTLYVIHSANDKEDERFSYDSVVSGRALREIYMMPFMLAQKYAQPWAMMTA